MLGLKFMRLLNDMSQTEVGDIVGVSKQCVDNWEKGRRSVSEDYCNTIATYFGVTPKFLKKDFTASEVAEKLQGGMTNDRT